MFLYGRRHIAVIAAALSAAFFACILLALTPSFAHAQLEEEGQGNLLILVRFAGDTQGDYDSDADEYTGYNQSYLGGAVANNRTQWEHLTNMLSLRGDNYCRGTVREYIYEMSSGAVDVQYAFPQTLDGGHVAYLTLNHDVSYYYGETSNLSLAADVISRFNQAYPQFDAGTVDTNNDGFVDNVTILAQVPASYGSWSSRRFDVGGYGVVCGTGSNARTVFNCNFLNSQSISSNIMVVAHEYLHSLGLRDLYERDGSDRVPVGIWDMMASTAGPPRLSTQSRADLGWTQLEEADGPGTYTLYEAGSASGPQSLIMRSPLNTSEYFVVEYRKKGARYSTDLDIYAGCSGVIVYRVNPAFASEGSNGEKDYLYVFRPGDTNERVLGGDGKVCDASRLATNAALSANGEWTAIGSTDLGDSFSQGALVFSDGTNAGLRVEVVEEGPNWASVSLTCADFEYLQRWTDLGGSQIPASDATAGSFSVWDNANYALVGSNGSFTLWKTAGDGWQRVATALTGVSQAQLMATDEALFCATLSADYRTIRLLRLGSGEWETVGSKTGSFNSLEATVIGNQPLIAVEGADPFVQVYAWSGASASEFGPAITLPTGRFGFTQVKAMTLFQLNGNPALSFGNFATNDTRLYVYRNGVWDLAETYDGFARVQATCQRSASGQQYLLIGTDEELLLYAYSDGTLKKAWTVTGVSDQINAAKLVFSGGQLFLCANEGLETPSLRVFVADAAQLDESEESVAFQDFDGVVASPIDFMAGVDAFASDGQLVVACQGVVKCHNINAPIEEPLFAISEMPYAGCWHVLTYLGQAAEGEVPQLHGNPLMLWNGAYVTLVSGSELEALSNDDFACVAGEAQQVFPNADISGNGKVNIVDVQIAYDVACGVYDGLEEGPSAVALLTADMNGDAFLDAADVRAIQCAAISG